MVEDTLVLEAAWPHGEASEEYPIAEINALAVGPDGHVYAWDPVTPALWMIDPAGKQVTQISRTGSGPGEYVRVTSTDLPLLTSEATQRFRSGAHSLPTESAPELRTLQSIESLSSDAEGTLLPSLLQFAAAFRRFLTHFDHQS